MANPRRNLVLAWLRHTLFALAVALALPATQALAAPVDDVKAAELKRFEVMVKGDWDALAKVLADDLSYTHSSGVFETKEEFLGKLRAGSLKYVKMEPSEIKVRLIANNVAVINALAKVDLVADGAAKNISLRYTDVWVKKAGRWQMTAWHSVKLP